MTFSNGGGFVQAQPAVEVEAADEFVSNNFSNSAQTGFDLNAGESTDAYGTPANTIQIYSGFHVGPTSGAHIDLGYTGSTAEIDLSSGLAGETGPARIYATQSATVASNVSALELQSPTDGAGTSNLQIFPSKTGQIAGIGATTTGVSPLSGINGLMYLGTTGTDNWALAINNENSVSGGNIPGLIIGADFPGNVRSRMFVSSNEILTLDGNSLNEPLYLNENNTESTFGGVVNKGMRHQFARDTATYTITPGTVTFSHPTGSTAGFNFILPASGTFTYLVKCEVTANGASGTLYLDAVVFNVTQSTTPWGGSTNDGAVIGSGNATNNTYTVFNTLGPATPSGSLGNAGDTMQIIVSYLTSAATTWTITRQQVTVMPSL